MNLVRAVISSTVVAALSLGAAASPAVASPAAAAPVAELRTDLILFGPLLAGEPSPTTVWTWNSGDSAAADVATTIEAPPGWAFSPLSGVELGRVCSMTPDATSVTCTYESIAPATRRDIELLLTPPSGSGTGTVTVETETPTPESGIYPNTDAKIVRYAPAGIDIVAVSADHDPDTPRARAPELSTITWRFRNATPERLSDGIAFSVQVPDGAEAIFMETRAIEDGGSSGSNCDVEGDPEPSCPLDSREIDQIEVTLFVAYDTAGSYTFTALAESDGEQSPGDESLAHTVEVEASATDLTLWTVAPSAEVTVGEVLTYTAFVTNGGPQPATEVEVADQLPAGVEIVSVTHGWFDQPCIIDDDGYVCRPGWFGYLEPGATAFVNVAVRPTAAGSVTIDPTVTGLQEDPDESSNIDPVSVVVVEPGLESPVDLQLSWQSPGPFVAGALVPVVAIVEVPAGRAATDVELDVSGADNLEIVSSAQGWFSSPCASPTSCAIPMVPAGSFGFVVLHVRPLAPGPFSVDVTVAAAQPDPDPSDNAVTIRGDAA